MRPHRHSLVLLLLALAPQHSSSLSAPPARCAGSAALAGYAMTWDSGRRMVVIFGGETSDGTLSSDTWGWDGHAWTCLTPASAEVPSARSAAMLGYDEKRGVLVLYGGRIGRQGLRDTWELDRSGWRRKDSAGPTSDPHGVLAYDAASGGVLLFHSQGDEGPTRSTWSWSGIAWARIAEGPNQEFPDAMFPSYRREPAILLTARPGAMPDAFDPPIYQWRDRHWSPVQVSGDIPHFSPQAPAARTRTGALLYAGYEPDGSVTTWVLERSTWKKYAGASPPRRRGAHMEFDPVRGVVVLHGGDDGKRILGDTWEWDGNRWREK